MQNNMMGAMPMQGAAPANPTGLSFQSDPSMRAQFKGFMSGMNAKQQAPMMQQPLPIPAPMQNIDIFQPMGMAGGGPVPRTAEIAGQPHMLSYITPGEAAALSYMGGSGAPGPGGIPSFFFSEGMGVDDGGGSFGGSTGNFSSGGGETSSGSDDYDPPSRSFGRTSSKSAPASIGYDQGQVDSALARAVSTGMGGTGSSQNFSAGSFTESSGDESIDALNRAIANTQRANQAEQQRQLATQDPALSQRFDDIQAADTRNLPTSTTIADMLGENVNTPGAGVGTANEVKSIRDSVDEAAANNNLLGTDDLLDFGGSGTALPSQGPTSRPEGLGPSSLGSIGVEEANPAAFGRGGREAPELGFDLGGMGTEGEAVPSSAVQQAIDDARAQGGDTTTVELGPKGGYSTQFEQVRDIPTYDPNAEVPDIFTTPQGNKAMNDLLDRAQDFKEGKVTGFIDRLTGGNLNFANQMANDIINNGYTPLFGANGDIVGTQNPETGQFGVGTVEARLPGYGPPNTGGGGGGFSGAIKQLGKKMEEMNEQKSETSPMINLSEGTGSELPSEQTQSTASSTDAAQGGLGLRLGYGQYNPLRDVSSSLNTAADNFLNLLGGQSR